MSGYFSLQRYVKLSKLSVNFHISSVTLSYSASLQHTLHPLKLVKVCVANV